VKEKSETVILIVEDEGLIALHMMEFLACEGYQVLEPVSTGEEAVKRCGDSPRPDLIIMDISLAGRIDGLEATRRIQEHYQIPVLILTACNNEKTGKQVKDLAPDGFLVKPSTSDEVLSAISLILQSNTRKNLEKAGQGSFRDLKGLTGH
jgi:DNA-binding NarL/FixJ family response regulator